jgi:hypothetical protein
MSEEVKREPVSQETLDGLREMAGFTAVKGPLLLQLLDEIERGRRPTHPESAVSGERLAEIIADQEASLRYWEDSSNFDGRKLPAELLSMNKDAIAALRELQQRRIGEG